MSFVSLITFIASTAVKERRPTYHGAMFVGVGDRAGKMGSESFWLFWTTRVDLLVSIDGLEKRKTGGGDVDCGGLYTLPLTLPSSFFLTFTSTSAYSPPYIFHHPLCSAPALAAPDLSRTAQTLPPPLHSTHPPPNHLSPPLNLRAASRELRGRPSTRGVPFVPPNRHTPSSPLPPRNPSSTSPTTPSGGMRAMRSASPPSSRSCTQLSSDEVRRGWAASGVLHARDGRSSRPRARGAAYHSPLLFHPPYSSSISLARGSGQGKAPARHGKPDPRRGKRANPQ